MLLPLLRSRVQGDVLALTYLHPTSEYTLTELARRVGASVRAVHHEVERLVSTGFLEDRRQGNNRLVRAPHDDNPVVAALTTLLAVTHGPLPVLTTMLEGKEGVQDAYIFGSWAARYAGEVGPVPADVDLLVVGDADPDDVDELAREAELTLARPVNATVVRPTSWRASLEPSHQDDRDPFLASLRERPLLRLRLRSATDEHVEPPK